MNIARILVANRGEIARRIIRTIRDLGLESVAIYSDADAHALHVADADHAMRVGGPLPVDSYLDQDAVLEAARAAGADAIHPGYGFLAENAEFARRCVERGIAWIGPPPEAIEAMGSKTAARSTMQAAGVPVVPGTVEPVASLESARAEATRIGYPVAVKAASGGGGKGFRVALNAEEIEDAFEGASGEGERYFSDPRVYLERYLPNPRHVEVQVLADTHGNVIHLGERDCTLQRRHQKLVEESPSPFLSDAQRAKISEIGVSAARAVGYVGAGTVECLATRDEVFFLEMNTRIQVEHPVTELVTGIDLIAEQLRVASGEQLSISQDEVECRGHAIEVRINAEDAFAGYAPSSGRINGYREPAGPWVRVDSGVGEGSPVPAYYDNLLAKVIVWGPDRESARRRLIRAVDEMEVRGVDTLLPFHRSLLRHEEFVAAGGCHEICADPTAHLEHTPARAETVAGNLSTGVLAPRGSGRGVLESATGGIGAAEAVEVDGHRYMVRLVPAAEHSGDWTPRAARGAQAALAGGTSDGIVAPIPGTVVRIDVEPGDEVAAGQRVCVLEAMKMENEITAPDDGVVEEILIEPGASVGAGQPLVTLR